MIHPLCAWLVIGVVSIFLLLHQLWNAPSSPVAAPYSRLDFGSHPYIRFITTNAVQVVFSLYFLFQDMLETNQPREKP